MKDKVSGSRWSLGMVVIVSLGWFTLTVFMISKGPF